MSQASEPTVYEKHKARIEEQIAARMRDLEETLMLHLDAFGRELRAEEQTAQFKLTRNAVQYAMEQAKRRVAADLMQEWQMIAREIMAMLVSEEDSLSEKGYSE